MNGGYNSRPTFFGCDNPDVPLVIYVPSYPWSHYQNTSTVSPIAHLPPHQSSGAMRTHYTRMTALKQQFKLDYSLTEATEVVLSGMRSTTLNSTVPTWPKCLACALTDQAFGGTKATRVEECQKCFDVWCWDGGDVQIKVRGESTSFSAIGPHLVASRSACPPSSVQHLHSLARVWGGRFSNEGHRRADCCAPFAASRARFVACIPFPLPTQPLLYLTDTRIPPNAR